MSIASDLRSIATDLEWMVVDRSIDEDRLVRFANELAQMADDMDAFVARFCAPAPAPVSADATVVSLDAFRAARTGGQR
ncbi:MAG: hypothetical protein EAZ99_14605 [Alphaproteobacteria bacterium]|nr:MAG: hypothetical protein EAZ99_14605 [Alphaproteobacteria bacterium]